MKISVDYSEVYQASVYVKNKAEDYNDLILNEMFQIILEYSNVLKQTASVYEQLQQDRVAQAKLLL